MDDLLQEPRVARERAGGDGDRLESALIGNGGVKFGEPRPVLPWLFVDRSGSRKIAYCFEPFERLGGDCFAAAEARLADGSEEGRLPHAVDPGLALWSGVILFALASPTA